jgi:signal transduction histidine kinase
MERRSAADANSNTLLSRLELVLVLVTVLFAALFALGGGVVMGREWLIYLLAVVLVMAFLFNVLLVLLDRRGAVEWMITWGARLGNLAFLTAGIYLTDGFSSPFFSLYAVYVVVGGLRYGWRGTTRSVFLCSLSWLALALLQPPADPQGWAHVAMLVSSFLVIALVVGALSQRHVRFWQESQRRNRELALLQEAGRSLGASLDPQEVLAVTLAQVNEVLEVEAASLALVDQETGWIIFELAIGGGNEQVKGLRLEPGQGIVGQVISEGRSVLVSDAASDPRWYNGVDQISGYETRSVLCVPLQTKGQVIGALEVLNKRDGPFSEEDRQLLSSLASLAAQCIENARLHEQIRQHVQRLREAYEEVRKLDDLKSSFIRNVSHELRTPLALIEGYLELLLDEQLGALRPEQRRSLVVVAEKAEQLHRMVNDIISLQSIGAMGFDLEVLSLLSLARAAVDEVRERAEKAGIDFDLAALVYEDQLQVRGDVRRLGQVFAHLLDNAIKFSPNGGTVSVSLGREQDMVFARVKDEGIGLDTRELERVFDRFYQIDSSSTRRYGGTGLGLALVKEVVEAHGGAVWCESDGIPGEGSTFTVFMPACGEGGMAA